MLALGIYTQCACSRLVLALCTRNSGSQALARAAVLVLVALQVLLVVLQLVVLQVLLVVLQLVVLQVLLVALQVLLVALQRCCFTEPSPFAARCSRSPALVLVGACSSGCRLYSAWCLCDLGVALTEPSACGA